MCTIFVDPVGCMYDLLSWDVKHIAHFHPHHGVLGCWLRLAAVASRIRSTVLTPIGRHRPIMVFEGTPNAKGSLAPQEVIHMNAHLEPVVLRDIFAWPPAAYAS